MEFDPVGSAKSIPDMIKNDTLIEVLDQDQLSECLKHITLNVDDSLYIFDQVQSKYQVPDRFKAIQHIITDFGEGNKFDSKKFVEFIKSLGQCLNLNILDTIATIVESEFSKIDQLSSEIKQKLQKTATKLFFDVRTQTQQTSTPQTQSQAVNKTIEELRKIPKKRENFNQIYEICLRITKEKDRDAMSFAVREKFVYVTEKIFFRNIFNKAAECNNQDLVHFLIESGIDINSKDIYSKTALMRASRKGHHEVVKLLLAVPGIDVNAKDDDKETALSIASMNGRHEVVKLLLTVPGINVNAKDNIKRTALILASMNGRHEVVKLLLTVRGIDVNAQDKYNYTALIRASDKGHHEVVKLLLTVPGIDVNAKDNYNRTALIEASWFGYHEVVKLLLTVPGIDVNAKNYHHRTALIWASYQGHHEVVKLLLTVPGIDVNAKDDDKETALSIASMNGRHEIVKMLKDHGAN